jgi:hypothetical protein
VAPEFGKKHTATFELKEPTTYPNGAVLRFTLLQQYGGQHNLGHFRLSVTTAKGVGITSPRRRHGPLA